jgi:hypothetical protein
MWDDEPIHRSSPPTADMSHPSRTFLSPYSRSFTPPAIVSDPYLIDKKLSITPFLLGSRPYHGPKKRHIAKDPVAETLRHWGYGSLESADLEPSPKMELDPNVDWELDSGNTPCTKPDNATVLRVHINTDPGTREATSRVRNHCERYANQ